MRLVTLVTTGNTRERCHPADYITLRLRMNMVFCAATVLSHPCPSWVNSLHYRSATLASA
jgi:hypothetical protein